MGRKRAESPSNIKFQHPDRSGPKEKTLLELAEERGLFAQAQKKQEENDKAKNAPKIKKIPIKPETKDDDDDDTEPLSAGAERFLDTTLYTMSLTMLHFTLDVLVQNQYSADRIVWPKVWMRALQALFGMSPPCDIESHDNYHLLTSSCAQSLASSFTPSTPIPRTRPSSPVFPPASRTTSDRSSS